MVQNKRRKGHRFSLCLFLLSLETGRRWIMFPRLASFSSPCIQQSPLAFSECLQEFQKLSFSSRWYNISVGEGEITAIKNRFLWRWLSPTFREEVKVLCTFFYPIIISKWRSVIWTNPKDMFYQRALLYGRYFLICKYVIRNFFK